MRRPKTVSRIEAEFCSHADLDPLSRCGAAYPVADELRGRSLLCKECDEPIVVEGGGAAAARRKRWPVRFVVGVGVVVLALLPGAALGALWWTGWLWDHADWPDFDNVGVGVHGPAVTLHVAGVAHAGRWADVADDLGFLADDGHARLIGWATRGDRATVLLARVSDPEALARRIDFGTVRRVHGRVITVTLSDGGRAEPVAKALADLNSDNSYRRRAAARRLSRLSPDDRRPEVARALESRLDDPTAHGDVIGALGRWGTEESVTPLLVALRNGDGIAGGALGMLHEAGAFPDERRGEIVRPLEALLQDERRGDREVIIRALGEFKDPGSAEPLAKCLEDFFDRDVAATALRALGPAAEQAVVRRLKHEDFRVRADACAVLAEIGTPESLPALKALEGDFFTAREAREASRAITTRHAAEQKR